MESTLLSLAQVSVAYGDVTSGRVRALLAVAAGLISVVSGALVLVRSARATGTGNGRGMAVFAFFAGLIGIVLSGLHLATATGAIGTGSGRLGAIVALVLSLIGTVVGARRAWMSAS
jgi:hypothetical protein